LNILVSDELPASALEVLRAEAGWTVDNRTGRSPEQLSADIAAADALLVRSATRVDKRLLAAAPRLRIVARAGTGVDNVDVEAASARGILVINAPGANSVSVAEHSMALVLSLARSIPAADRAMKEERWERRRFLGTELRGKTLGIVGFGRVGRELGLRARAFGMEILAHDPFIPAEIASDAGASLVALDELCAQADFISLHLPATPDTRHLFDAGRLARCKAGVRIVNTARGDLIEARALAQAIENGAVAGAALDVFETEPPDDWSLAKMPQVIATPHIAASTEEAQEMVGVETAIAVRDFLKDGLVRNAVNFAAVQPDDLRRLQPWMRLADALGAVLTSDLRGRMTSVTIGYYGALADTSGTQVLAAMVVAALLRPIVSGGASFVNARLLARERGLSVVESRSSRPRDYASLLSVRLRTDDGEHAVEGTVFEPSNLKLVSLDDVSVEAPISGTLLLLSNDDQPGVIGEVGTILGRHGVNIAQFALGRRDHTAVAVVNIDDSGTALEHALDEIRRIPAIRRARIVRV